MADTENREDQKISECLREAFGYSDDQLLKQLDQANETFKDVNFTGAEDRLMKRFLARKAELEKETASQTPTLVPQNESANIQIAEELPKKTVTVISEAEEKKKNEKKVIRFGKKKVLATAALVAVIAGMLGGTAIGKKSYFFRRLKNSEPAIYMDNYKNKEENSHLEEAYNKIKSDMNIPLLRLNYRPTNMSFEGYTVYNNNEVELTFLYEENIIRLLQIQNKKSTSANMISDRQQKNTIYNKWLKKNIEYSSNTVEDGSTEYEAVLLENGGAYYLFGNMPKLEFEKILKNIIFYSLWITFVLVNK